ncbi:MAG: hypothetical protein KAW01_00425, partial [Deltaproteobacteria bacterium]|nr:hypothetical protein [Deltaproteobacteria bacterium]
MDINNLLISQDYSNNNGSVEVITQVPIRKPFKTEFVRVHRDKIFSITPVAIFEDRQFRCTYMVAPDLVKIMNDYYSPATLITAINKQGVVFLWPLKLPKNGRDNAWFQSARETA